MPRTKNVDGKRQCAECREWFDATADNFRVLRRSGVEYLNSYCNPCARSRERERNKTYYVKHAENYRKSILKRRYGLTPEAHAELLASQGGACAICRSGEPGGRGGWHVDHDHSCCAGKVSCGKCVRGLLCHGCNVGLGNLKDSADILRAALQYLKESREVSSPVRTGA